MIKTIQFLKQFERHNSGPKQALTMSIHFLKQKRFKHLFEIVKTA